MGFHLKLLAGFPEIITTPAVNSGEPEQPEMKKCSVGENSRSVFACLRLPIPIWIGDIH